MRIITEGIDTEGRGWIPEPGDTIAEINGVLNGMDISHITIYNRNKELEH